MPDDLPPGEVTKGENYEEEHVHVVYEQIASHFSSTRYKVKPSHTFVFGTSADIRQPWPIIERFLKSLPEGSVGLDIGCGNGKYLAVNPNVYIIGSDRSHNLAQIATRHQPHSVVVADILDLPHATRSFDFAISIAVVHHLSTAERRIEAISSILQSLTIGGRALIYVWALEQESSRRGWTENDEQDVMVPWVMKGAKSTAPGGEVASADKTFHRYYHLYRKGELERDVGAAGGVVVEAGYEKDNWWAIAERSRLPSE